MSEADDKKPEERHERSHHPLASVPYQTAIDQQIADAIAKGQFDNLGGKGRPLPADDDTSVPPELRMAFRMLKSNDFAPPWIEARKEIAREQIALHEWLTDANRRWPKLGEATRQKLQAEYRARLTELHRSILNHNLTLPPGAGQMGNIRIDIELKRLGGE